MPSRLKKIFKKYIILRKKKVKVKKPLSKKYILEKKYARELALTEIERINEFYNFSYNKIYIRNQKTRWGSCSNRRNLNFNYKIIFLPPHLLEYIITHELCHLEEMNHGINFWKLIEKTIPDYQERHLELKKIRVHK